MSIDLPVLPGLGAGVQAAPTPYASPAAQQAQRDYAKALMYGTVGKDGRQFPVVQSWTQGASNMINALMGGLEARDADNKDIARYQTAVPEKPTPTSFSEGPSSEGHEKAADGDMSKEADAIASIESKGSGDYSAVGPVTHTGDRAYGKYQVMGANIPSWTKEVLGKELTPAEFLSNQAAQDQVFKTKFAQGAGNDADRASVWFTGKPLAQGGNRSDGYITGNQYVDRFNKAMGTPAQGGGGAMAFAGPDGGATNPAVAAMASALKGTPPQQMAENGIQPVASKTAVPGQLPQPNGSGMYYDPRLIKPPPQYSADQVRAIMASPELSPEAKATAMQAYRQQGQPIELPYPGGHIIVDPLNPTRQQFIPDLQKGTSKIGDVEVPSYGVVGPAGAGGANMQNYPINRAPPPPVGPQSSNVPTAAPTVAPQPVPAVTPPPGPVVAQNAPPPPVASPAAPPVAPVQVASNDPQAAFAAAAGKPPLSPVEQQMMAMAGPKQPLTGVGPGAVPPEGKPEVIPVAAKEAAAPVVTQPKSAPLTKLAANDDAIRALVGPDVYEAYKQKKDADTAREVGTKAKEADIAVDQNAREKNNDLNAKRYVDMQDATSAAIKQVGNLGIASAMMSDPNFYSGLGNGVVENVKKLSAALGIDPNASAPMEVFRKTMASSIANGLKAAYGGLGQIRNKEIELQEKANGSLASSPAANRALIEISRRNANQMAQIGEIATEYRNGGEIQDPITGEVLAPANIGPDGQQKQRVGLDPGYDKIAIKFLKEHPVFSPEELSHFNKTIDEANTAPKEGAQPGQKADASKFPAPPGEAVTMLKSNPAAAAHFDEIFGPGAAAKVLGTK